MVAQFKDMVVFMEEEREISTRASFAARLAESCDAHLIGTFVVHRLQLDRYAGFARGEGIENMMHTHRRKVDEAEARAKEIFHSHAQRQGISCEWRRSEQEVGETLMLHARHASLAIMGLPAKPSEPLTTLALSEDVIFASGRPSLLLPQDWKPERQPGRIIVAWNGSREATRAISDAMPLLVKADDVRLIVIRERKLAHLFGADPGVDITRHLARHGVRVGLEQFSKGDPGLTLLDRAHAIDADLLVMGAYGHSRTTEFILGGATRTMFEKADIPILLSR
ncbi:universal stress protein [Rhizobium binxianense]